MAQGSGPHETWEGKEPVTRLKRGGRRSGDRPITEAPECGPNHLMTPEPVATTALPWSPWVRDQNSSLKNPAENQ